MMFIKTVFFAKSFNYRFSIFKLQIVFVLVYHHFWLSNYALGAIFDESFHETNLENKSKKTQQKKSNYLSWERHNFVQRCNFWRVISRNKPWKQIQKTSEKKSNYFSWERHSFVQRWKLENKKINWKRSNFRMLIDFNPQMSFEVVHMTSHTCE